MISAFKVLQKSGAGRDYPTSLFCSLIPQIEQEFVRECLGSALWEYLLSKQVMTPTDTPIWENCGIYQDGDIVNYFGNLFESLINNNTSDPWDNQVEWKAFEMFNNAGAQDLWDKYLCSILAQKVYQATLTRSTHRVGSGGVVINAGDSVGLRSGNKSEISSVRGDILLDIERTTTNMIDFLKTEGKTLGLPLPPICTAGTCNTKGSSSRRWGFTNQQYSR